MPFDSPTTMIADLGGAIHIHPVALPEPSRPLIALRAHELRRGGVLVLLTDAEARGLIPDVPPAHVCAQRGEG